MDLSNTYIWMITGVIFLFAEALGVSGAGLMFAGLAAITVGAFIQFGAVAADALVMQLIVFLMSTAGWTLILWKPMRRYYSSKNKSGYQNIVGDTAYIGAAGLKRGETGEATWSGTIMKARLAEAAHQHHVEGGSAVEIVEVKGATLIVKPKG